MLISTRFERLGLLVSTIIFALVAIAQFWRALANVPVDFGGHLIPVWASLLVGLVALAMAFWMGVLLKNRRPLI